MAIFRNLRVRLRFESSKYFNVFLRLKPSPSLTLQKISHSRTDSYETGVNGSNTNRDSKMKGSKTWIMNSLKCRR